MGLEPIAGVAGLVLPVQGRARLSSFHAPSTAVNGLQQRGSPRAPAATECCQWTRWRRESARRREPSGRSQKEPGHPDQSGARGPRSATHTGLRTGRGGEAWRRAKRASGVGVARSTAGPSGLGRWLRQPGGRSARAAAGQLRHRPTAVPRPGRCVAPPGAQLTDPPEAVALPTDGHSATDGRTPRVGEGSRDERERRGSMSFKRPVCRRTEVAPIRSGCPQARRAWLLPSLGLPVLRQRQACDGGRASAAGGKASGLVGRAHPPNGAPFPAAQRQDERRRREHNG